MYLSNTRSIAKDSKGTMCLIYIYTQKKFKFKFKLHTVYRYMYICAPIHIHTIIIHRGFLCHHFYHLGPPALMQPSAHMSVLFLSLPDRLVSALGSSEVLA